jgi:MoxR-like ATPase
VSQRIDERAHDGGRSGRLGSPDLERALFEVKKVVVGQDRMVERMLVALLARGHCLLEGVPGVAKSLAVETLATVVGGSSVRLQFTPDLVPSDILGTRIYRASQEAFDVELGPVFANLVLADEINRAPAKVQSALLEVMAERQVSIGGVTHPLPTPFLVLATQNPIESEGVYPLPRPSGPLPHAGRRRPPDDGRGAGDRPADGGVPAVRPAGAVAGRAARPAVRRRPHLRPPRRRGVRRAARDGHAGAGALGAARLRPLLAHGASPRGSLGLVQGAKALAVLRGRDYVLPVDVADLAVDVLAHRLVLTYEALADEVPATRLARAGAGRRRPAAGLAQPGGDGLAGR